jgi:putative endopeptidase
MKRLTTIRALIGGAALGLSLVVIAQQAGSAPQAKPQIGTWGFDLTGMDRSVKPGDDFFRFGGGTWL